MTRLDRVRPVIFGEVLYDCFPGSIDVLGGAPFNVAWNLQAFGMSPLLISRVGNDLPGHRIQKAMEQWGMERSGLQQDPANPTGRVDVTLSRGEPTFQIADNSAWDHISGQELPAMDNILLYHGSLAVRSPGSLAALESAALKANNGVFVDINLRSPWWQRDTIDLLLSRARWIKLNEKELEIVTDKGSSIQERIKQLPERFPAQLFIITLGAAGALLMDREGRVQQSAPLLPPKVTDTVGAGDAFSSVILLGILLAWPPATMLQRAQDFAARVTTIQGATSPDRSFYQPFIDNWGLRP